MTGHPRRSVVFVLVVGIFTIGSVLAGPALGTTAGVPTGSTDSMIPADHPDSVFDVGRDRTTHDRSGHTVETSAIDGRPAPHEPAERSERAPRWQAFPAPFAQADDDDDDEETHVINISTPGDPVEYTLTAPDLSPDNDVDLVDDDGNESNQDVISGDSAAGFIGNGNYDAYAFTGPVDAVRLDSANIDDLEVTIDGEPVDPRTLTGDGTETTTTEATTAETTETTATTAEPTTTETTEAEETTTGTEETSEETVPSTTGETTGSTSAATTDTTSTDAATTDTSTPTTPAATAAAPSGSESGQSRFGIVMFVLIGVVSGLVLAGALAYVVGSDRFG